MKATQITATGLKVGQFTHELTSPVVLFKGPNGAGKSARIDALRLAMAGYLPELGKQGAATMKLASRDEMRVVATFNDGEDHVVSRCWTRKGKSVSVSADGDIWFDPVLVDPTIYFGLSPAKKTEYLFGMLPVEELVDVDKLVDEIANLRTAAEAKASTEKSEVAKYAAEERQTLIEHINATDRERHENDEDVQHWLEAQIDWAKGCAKHSKDEVTRMVKAAEAAIQLAETTIRVEQDPSGDLDDARGDLQHALTRKNSADQQIRERDRLQVQIDGLAKDIVYPDEERSELEEKITEINELIDGFLSIDELQNLDRELAMTRADIRVCVAEEDRVRRDIDELANATCASCGQALPKEKVEQLREAKNEVLNIALEKKAKAEARVEEIEKELADGSLQDLMKLREKADGYRRVLNHIIDLDAKTERKRTLENELARLTIEDTTQLAEDIETLQDQVKDLELRAKEFVQHRANQANMGQAVQAKERAEQRHEIDKKTVKVLQEFRTELVAKAFESVLDPANRFLKTCGCHFTLECRDGAIGTSAGGDWRSHETLSGMETALTFAAVAIAIAYTSASKIVFFDEFGVFSETTKDTVVGGLWTAAKEGWIDQAFLADCDYVPATDDVQVVDVTEGV